MSTDNTSDTPFTDKNTIGKIGMPGEAYSYESLVHADFARQLERELNAAQEELKVMRWVKSELVNERADLVDLCYDLIEFGPREDSLARLEQIRKLS